MILRDLFKSFVDKQKKQSVGTIIKKAISEAVDEAQQRLQRAVDNALKSVLLMGLSFVALIFILVGMSKYLSASVVALANGLGFVVVGIGLLVLIFLFHALQKHKSER